MSGSPNDLISLRDHLETLRRTDLENAQRRYDDLVLRLQQRFEATQKAVEAAFEASQKAAEKAERAQELRNVVSNEFRGTLTDQATRLWPIKEGQAAVEQLESKVMTAIDGLDKRLAAVEQFQSNITGRIAAYASLAAFAGVAVAIVGHFWR